MTNSYSASRVFGPPLSVILFQGMEGKARKKCPENGQIRSTKH